MSVRYLLVRLIGHTASRLLSFARTLATRDSVAPTLSTVLRRGGAIHLARRLDLRRGALPPDTCTVKLPPSFQARYVTMRTVGGRDQVAMRLFTHGWESFEEPLPAFLASAVHDGSVVLDVGANTGYYALLAASVGSHGSCPEMWCKSFRVVLCGRADYAVAARGSAVTSRVGLVGVNVMAGLG